MFWKELIRQMMEIGVGSIGIVVIISLFLGAVLTVQTAYQFTTPFLSKNIIGSIVTNSILLEIGPSVTCLILAGKIGSNVASELGTMRISEQIDALEIMGVNSASYLILPKIIASVIMVPMLIIIAMFLGITSGVLVGGWTGAVSQHLFIQGSIEYFIPFTVTFALIKATTFGFFISSVAAYFGYYTEGGSFEVGRTSTKAIVTVSIILLIADYILAQLLL
jgi:phospholipid/cholesterol/gamma-HCH transport system permease protein